MSVILTFSGSVAAGAATGVLADTTVHSGLNVAISAAVTVIVGVIAAGALRSLRVAKKEHAVNRDILNEVKAGLFGREESTVNGIRHAAAAGIIDQVARIEERVNRLDDEGSGPMRAFGQKLDDLAQATREQLAQHEQQIRDTRQAAGVAAVAAATVKDRVDFLNERIWERFEGLEIRNQMLTALAEREGFEVGQIPPLDDDEDGVSEP